MKQTATKMAALSWEAPAGRATEQKIVVRLDSLRAVASSFAGSIENHPSVAHGMPDPVELEGTVLRHDPTWTALAVKLKVPKYKVRQLAVHDRVALAIIAPNTCICATRVPDAVSEDALEAWLERWDCDE